MSKIQELTGFIDFPSGFKLLAEAPIDARFVGEGQEFLESIIEVGAVYKGLRVYLTDEGKFYVYKKDLDGSYKFIVDEISLSEEQKAALNSGITESKVTAYDLLTQKAVTSVVEGSSNGSINVNGKDVKVHGLGEMAYKDSVSKEDVGLDKVNNVAITEEEVKQISTNSKSIEKLNTETSSISGKISSKASSEDKVLSESEVDQKVLSSSGRQVSSNASGDPFSTKSALLAGPYYYNGVQTTLKVNDTATVSKDETKENLQVLYIRSESEWAIRSIMNSTFSSSQQAALDSGITQTIRKDLEQKTTNSESHISNKENPHGVTKDQLGLGNVENTADLDKPISTAQKSKNDQFETDILSALDKAQKALAMAESGTRNYSFDTTEAMVNDLKEAESTKYKVGTNLLIKDLNVPDYWITEVHSETKGDYGYYEIQILETKIDLEAYQTKSDDTLKTSSKTIVGGINELKDSLDTAKESFTTELTNLGKAVEGKVSKEEGKGLSTEDYTSEEKVKLSGIEEGAQKNYEDGVRDANYKHITIDPENGVTDGENTYKYQLPGNVVKDEDYTHTDNNFTDTEKSKLTGIEEGAEKNVQADYEQGDSTKADYIKNKPTLGELSKKDKLEADDIPEIETSKVSKLDGIIKVINEKLASIENRGLYLGSVTTTDNLPSNVSFFTEQGKAEPDINDFMIVKYDVEHIVYDLTKDTTFQSGKSYYTRSGSGTKEDPYVYTKAEVTVGETIPANTYYEYIGTYPEGGVGNYTIKGISTEGDITWDWAYSYSVDITGKVDKIGDWTSEDEDYFPVVSGSDGNGKSQGIKPSKYKPESFATSEQGEMAETAYQLKDAYKIVIGKEGIITGVGNTSWETSAGGEYYKNISFENHKKGQITNNLFIPRVRVFNILISETEGSGAFNLEEIYDSVKINSKTGEVQISSLADYSTDNVSLLIVIF